MQAIRVATVLLIASATTAEAGDALSIVVHGPIDADAVRARVARELGTTVALADSCSVPCLEVSVAAGKASVAFTPRTGSPRARIVELGDDHKQWPLVVTLLAGNVVRDEADDVLAQLPVIGPQPVATGVPPAIEATPPASPDDPTTNTPEPDEVALAPEGAGPGSVAVLVPPQPELEKERMLLGVGLVPGLSTDWTHVGRVHHVLSLDLIAGVSGGSSLFTMSGIVDIERGDVWGFQLGGVAALSHRVAGFQVAGIATVTGDLTGVQIAGTAAIANNVDGLQVGGIAALARRHADSQFGGIAAVAANGANMQVGGIAAVAGSSARFQIGGIAAVAKGKANLQLGGIAAVAGGSANIQVGGIAAVAKGTGNIQVGGIAASADTGNIQVGGIASVARSANFQLAGLVNVASRLRGVQIAPINVARSVEGVQVGVINVGGSADGFSFGLINIVPGGRADVEATIDSSSFGTLLFRHGGNRWHNVYGVGGHPVDETGPTDDVWMYGLGFGPSWRVGRSRIDLEAMGWQVNHGARHSADVSILGQLRLSVAYGIGPFAIVAGGALNTYISDDHASPLLTERRKPSPTMDDGDVTVEVWPSAFIGLRL